MLNLDSLSPINGAIVPTTFTSNFVISGITTGYHIQIIINSLVIYDNNDGVITVDPDWTENTSLPLIQLTNNIPFTDPTQLNGQLIVDQTENLTVGFSWLVASYEFVGQSPNSEQVGIIPSANVIVGISASTNIGEISLKINDKLTVLPDFQVTEFILNATQQGLIVRKRRDFNFNEKVKITVGIVLTLDLESFFSAEEIYYFYITDLISNSTQSNLFSEYQIKPFENLPANEVYRKIILNQLVPKTAQSIDVLLYNKIKQSSLRALAPRIIGKNLDEELTKIVFNDLTNTNDFDTALQQIEILWEPAIEEAQRLKIDPEIITLIQRIHLQPFPQERVAAACMLSMLVFRQIN